MQKILCQKKMNTFLNMQYLGIQGYHFTLDPFPP